MVTIRSAPGSQNTAASTSLSTPKAPQSGERDDLESRAKEIAQRISDDASSSDAVRVSISENTPRGGTQGYNE